MRQKGHAKHILNLALNRAFLAAQRLVENSCLLKPVLVSALSIIAVS